jgi:anti-sigma regulatory factor (Ser/Thr protein kinase)
MNYSLALPIQDASQAGEARRLVAAWSQGRGWGQEMAGRVAIVVTELGRNLALHTQGGTLLVRSLSQGSAKGVEILSLDSGPGVANFHECLRDGHSTAGTAGTGLGAVKRASQVFATHSQPGIGTALLSEVWADPSDFSAGGHWRCGAVSVTMPGELVCGDSWAEQYGPPDVIRLMMADGLGHGEFAAEASARAMEIFERSPRIELTALLKQMHDGMRSTRGAAISIAEIDLARIGGLRRGREHLQSHRDTQLRDRPHLDERHRRRAMSRLSTLHLPMAARRCVDHDVRWPQIALAIGQVSRSAGKTSRLNRGGSLPRLLARQRRYHRARRQCQLMKVASEPLRLLTVEVRSEHDVVIARQRARQLAHSLGLEGQVQTRIATAVSELPATPFSMPAEDAWSFPC